MAKVKKTSLNKTREKYNFLGIAGKNMTYKDIKRKAIILGIPFPDTLSASIGSLLSYINTTTNKPDKSLIDKYDDWMDKYAYLIELGSGLEGMDEAHKTEENLIKGCQSRVWFHADMQDGLLYFTADSDAIITKGIAGLLIRVFSGQKPADIAKADLHFIDEIGLTQHLSPTRSNGLLAMVKQIKFYAIAAEAASQNTK